MKLSDVPTSELVRLSDNTRVQSYAIGFSLNGVCVLWKLRFEKNAITELFTIAPAIAVHFTKQTRRAQRKYKWPDSQNWPDDPPEFTEADWDFKNSKYPVVVAYRAEGFSDALIVALQIGIDLLRVIRLSPEQAVQIAELHWDEIQSGTLRDISAENPPTGSRH